MNAPNPYSIPTPDADTLIALLDRVDLLSDDLSSLVRRVGLLAAEFPLETALLIGQVHLQATARRLIHIRERFQALLEDAEQCDAPTATPNEDA